MFTARYELNIYINSGYWHALFGTSCIQSSTNSPLFYIIEIAGPDLIRIPICFEVYHGFRQCLQVNAALPFVTLLFYNVPEMKQPFQLRSSRCPVQGKQ